MKSNHKKTELADILAIYMGSVNPITHSTLQGNQSIITGHKVPLHFSFIPQTNLSNFQPQMQVLNLSFFPIVSNGLKDGK